MVAIMGAAAIEPALAAIRRGVVVALANKECVVAAGAVFRDALEQSGASVIPVDSEHNAIFQVLHGGDAGEVELVTITASGGPFREWTTGADARRHGGAGGGPSQLGDGPKISLDSASLMNKGLELIEAHFLFALPPEKRFAWSCIRNPSSIAWCRMTTARPWRICRRPTCARRSPMRWAWPRRIASPSRRLDLATMGPLSFFAPDSERFPCLRSGDGLLACRRARAYDP